jgi:hypothetical protein
MNAYTAIAAENEILIFYQKTLEKIQKELEEKK